MLVKPGSFVVETLLPWTVCWFLFFPLRLPASIASFHSKANLASLNQTPQSPVATHFPSAQTISRVTMTCEMSSGSSIQKLVPSAKAKKRQAHYEPPPFPEEPECGSMLVADALGAIQASPTVRQDSAPDARIRQMRIIEFATLR